MLTLFSCAAAVGNSCYLSQKELLRDYRHLVYWSSQFGQAAADAVLNMERQMGQVTFNTLRDLRPLMTPYARSQVLGVMQATTVNLKLFKEACLDAQHAMWRDWLWHLTPDDYIHPSKRMPPHAFPWLGPGCISFLVPGIIVLSQLSPAVAHKLHSIFCLRLAGDDSRVKCNWALQMGVEKLKTSLGNWGWTEQEQYPP